jgi:PD-(D/E)XK nuclease superfamily
METPMIYHDSSALVLLNCERRYVLAIVRGLQTHNTNTYANMGSAIHKLAEWLDPVCTDPARKNFTDLYSEDFTPIQLSTFLASRYQLDSNQGIALMNTGNALKQFIASTPAAVFVEKKFAIPYDGDTLCGTIDRGFWKSETHFHLQDYKSAASPKEPDKTLAEYYLNLQMYFYMYIVQNYWQELGLSHKPELVTGSYVGVFYNCSPVRIRETSAIYSFDEFVQLLALHIEKAKSLGNIYGPKGIGHSVLPAPTGILTSSCKYCQYGYICQSPERRQLELVQNLPTKEYNPLTFRD